MFAAIMGAWQMLMRSPLPAPLDDPNLYYASVTLHGTAMAYVVTTFFTMGFGYAVTATSLARQGALSSQRRHGRGPSGVARAGPQVLDCCQDCCYAHGQLSTQGDSPGIWAQQAGTPWTVLDSLRLPTDLKVGGSSPSSAPTGPGQRRLRPQMWCSMFSLMGVAS